MQQVSLGMSTRRPPRDAGTRQAYSKLGLGTTGDAETQSHWPTLSPRRAATIMILPSVLAVGLVNEDLTNTF